MRRSGRCRTQPRRALRERSPTCTGFPGISSSGSYASDAAGISSSRDEAGRHRLLGGSASPFGFPAQVDDLPDNPGAGLMRAELGSLRRVPQRAWPVGLIAAPPLVEGLLGPGRPPAIARIPPDGALWCQMLQSAWVGDRRAARMAGRSPARAPMSRAAARPPAQAWGGMTAVSPWPRA